MEPWIESLPTELRDLIRELNAEPLTPGRFKVGQSVLEVTEESWLSLVESWRAEAEQDSGVDAFEPRFAAGYAAHEIEDIFASKGRGNGLTFSVRNGGVDWS